MAEDLSWTSILQLAGVGGVVAAFANQGLKFAIDTLTIRASRERDAGYLAMRIAVIMEAYTAACEAHLLNREAEHAAGYSLDAGILPKLRMYPADVDWRALDIKLASQVLAFEDRIASSQTLALRAAAENDDYWITHFEAVSLGLASWSLAHAIRSKYRLGPSSLFEGEATALAKRHEQAEARRAEIQKKFAEATRG